MLFLQFYEDHVHDFHMGKKCALVYFFRSGPKSKGGIKMGDVWMMVMMGLLTMAMAGLLKWSGSIVEPGKDEEK
ncbi:hypothetical protein ANABIO32_38200 [Rossellomorea marisflavi]|nr:hypothetical protein ANABIO32_38200 [Rossellomorea marisflavi]